MPEFLYALPHQVVAPAIIGSLCAFGLGGLLLVRRYVLPRLEVHVEDSQFTGTMLQAILVFYGLAVALIAVNVWQSYSDSQKVISGEASAINALYRDVTSYPEPLRSQLQQALQDYTEQVVRSAWPLQQQGRVPTAGIAHMTHFQAMLDTFEPATEGQKLLHGEVLRAYNGLIQARRQRLDAVHTSLPEVLWTVVILGAFIGLTGTFFFRVADVRLHAIMVLLLAVFIGLVIFMIFALDQPFRGYLSLGAEPYQLLLDQLVKTHP